MGQSLTLPDGRNTRKSAQPRDLVRGAGHCIELHRPARAYVLSQLAFVESVIV